ncbi:MAG: heavy metal-binding domain-containing protein [Nitrospira sp. CG24A]|nr:MAG: heavy metal-binding domain-containing protein [Nitrospira sp. CG24A]
MILSTTNNIEGKKTVKHLGLVSGDAILGANIFRDFFASIRDIVGGRSAGYEKELRKAKNIALEEMQEQAKNLGANAIVGIDIDIDYETIGTNSSMLMVSANGTAVVVE